MLAAIDYRPALFQAFGIGRYVKNLVRAAGQGFESFGKNFLTHLKNALSLSAPDALAFSPR